MIQPTKWLAAMVVGCVCCVPARGDDWPQWLGPRRDGAWREKGIVKVFPEEGVTVKWTAPVASGYAGPAVAGGKVYVTDYVRQSGDPVNVPDLRAKLVGRERVLCLRATDGQRLWKHEYDCPYQVSYPRGPRATPTVADGKVYTLGTMGNLRCYHADTGELLWSKDLKKQYDTDTPHWGFTGHPLVDGQKLICLVGGKGSVAVALDKDTGAERWRSLSARQPGYCPPTIIRAGGTRQLIIWHVSAINGLNPETGAVYWSVPLQPNYDMSIAMPRQSGDYLFATGVTSTAVLLRLDRNQPAAEVAWRADRRTAVFCANSTPVIDENVIYGVCQDGALRAVDLLTGERLWQTYAATTGARRAQYGTAFIVKHEDRYFLFNEKGDLIMARLTREGYDELGRFHVLDPTNETSGRNVVWSHPAFANRAVYARNDKQLVCVSLAAE